MTQGELQESAALAIFSFRKKLNGHELAHSQKAHAFMRVMNRDDCLSVLFAVSARNDMIVLKKLDTGIKPEDLRTLKLIEEAWNDIEEGRYRVYSKKGFFKEFKKW